MGKQRRQRQKLHIPATKPKEVENDSMSQDFESTTPMNISLDNNPFADLNIDINNLQKSLQSEDDVHSVKSFKSMKSEKGNNGIKKKDKIKMRREILMKKIDAVNQMKKELKVRNKRKKVALVGDTNPLFDALCDIQIKQKPSELKVAKPRAILKADKRKKNYVKGVQIYKQIVTNKDFKSNPMAAISDHVKAIVEAGKANAILKKKK